MYNKPYEHGWFEVFLWPEKGSYSIWLHIIMYGCTIYVCRHMMFLCKLTQINPRTCKSPVSGFKLGEEMRENEKAVQFSTEHQRQKQMTQNR